jgi:hypothetical protein
MTVTGAGLIWMRRTSALIWHFIRTSVDHDYDGETKSDDEDLLTSASDGLYKQI